MTNNTVRDATSEYSTLKYKILENDFREWYVDIKRILRCNSNTSQIRKNAFYYTCIDK